MNRRFRIRMLLVGITLPVLACLDATAQVQPGAKIFEKSCYSCHTIGGGKKTGPDLKGATTRRTKDWLHAFITSAAGVKAKGDPVAADLFAQYAPTVMPDQPLTVEQIDQVLAVIDEYTKANKMFVPSGAGLKRPVTKADVARGLDYFTGSTPLRNGGPACISCHSIEGLGVFGGGSIGPDLTQVNIRFRDPELIVALRGPQWPTMKSVFATRAFTEEEIIALFALFQDQAKRQIHAPSQQAGLGTGGSPFIIAGGVGCIGAFVLVGFAWRRRLRGVRIPLVQRRTTS